MNGKPKVKRKTVQCVVCKSLVPKRDAIPYGPSAVCVACEREMLTEDLRRYEEDCQNEVLRHQLQWGN